MSKHYDEGFLDGYLAATIAYHADDIANWVSDKAKKAYRRVIKDIAREIKNAQSGEQ